MFGLCGTDWVYKLEDLKYHIITYVGCIKKQISVIISDNKM